MADNGKAHIDGGDFELVKSDLKYLKEEVGRISSVLEKTCSKVQFLGVADELVELKREVITIGSSLGELKKFIEQVVFPRSPGKIVNKSLSSNRVDAWGNPVRLNGFQDIRDTILPGFSTPKGSNDGSGSASSGKDSKYSKRSKGSKNEFISTGKICGKLNFDISPKVAVSSRTDARGAKWKVPAFRAGPFIVNRALKPLDLQLLQYAFDPSLDMTEIIVEMDFNDLIRGTFRSLQPCTWIDGEVISCVCEILTADSKREGNGLGMYSYVPPRYADVIFSRPTEWMGFVSSNYFKERYMSNLLNCKKAFFPILDRVSKHWFLLMVDLSCKRAEVWDSLQSVGCTDARLAMCKTVLGSLDVLFNTSNICNTSLKDMEFESFDVNYREDAPVQHNRYDCGMFVIGYMQDRCSKAKGVFQFDSHQRRADLTMNLLKTKLNRRWDTLEFLADEYCKNLRKNQAHTSDETDQATSSLKRKKVVV